MTARTAKTIMNESIRSRTPPCEAMKRSKGRRGLGVSRNSSPESFKFATRLVLLSMRSPAIARNGISGHFER